MSNTQAMETDPHIRAWRHQRERTWRDFDPTAGDPWEKPMSDESKAVAVQQTEERLPTPDGEARTIAALLDLAVNKGMSVEGIEKLVGLYERVADRQAQQEFADALASFQLECPVIPKSSKAKIVTKGGGSYTYFYADLAVIARTVQPLLHKHGLSYTWDSRNVDGKALEATCWLRHRNGHRESATFQLPIENPSAMNDQQKHAAALTYARRQSLIAVLGLSTAEPDSDGADPSRTIGDDEVKRLEELFDGLRVSKERFFRFLGHDIQRLEDIPAMLYPVAVNFLKSKRQQQDAAEVKAGAA